MNHKDDTIINHNTVITKTLQNDDTLKQLISQTAGVRILHMNIRSLRKNIDEFTVFLQGLGNEIDLIVLSEAFITEDLPQYEIPTYHNVLRRGKINKNDGVIIYYKEHLQITELDVDIIDCTSLLIKLKIDKKIF